MLSVRSDLSGHVTINNLKIQYPYDTQLFLQIETQQNLTYNLLSDDPFVMLNQSSPFYQALSSLKQSLLVRGQVIKSTQKKCYYVSVSQDGLVSPNKGVPLNFTTNLDSLQVAFNQSALMSFDRGTKLLLNLTFQKDEKLMVNRPYSVSLKVVQFPESLIWQAVSQEEDFLSKYFRFTQLWPSTNSKGVMQVAVEQVGEEMLYNQDFLLLLESEGVLSNTSLALRMRRQVASIKLTSSPEGNCANGKQIASEWQGLNATRVENAECEQSSGQCNCCQQLLGAALQWCSVDAECKRQMGKCEGESFFDACVWGLGLPVFEAYLSCQFQTCRYLRDTYGQGSEYIEVNACVLQNCQCESFYADCPCAELCRQYFAEVQAPQCDPTEEQEYSVHTPLDKAFAVSVLDNEGHPVGDTLVSLYGTSPECRLPYASEFTDQQGVALFQGVSVPVAGCTEFYWTVGDVKSLETSQVFCFRANTVVQIKKGYTLKFPSNKYMSRPIQVTIQQPSSPHNLSVIVARSVNPQQQTSLEGTVCVNVKQQVNAHCRLLHYKRDGNMSTYTFTMDALKWLGDGGQSLQLVISDLARYDPGVDARQMLAALRNESSKVLADVVEQYDKVKKNENNMPQLEDVAALAARVKTHAEQVEALLRAKPYDTTKQISINNEPSSLRIIDQPPRSFYVRDVFRVRVQAISVNQDFLQNLPVAVGIVPDPDFMSQLSSKGVQNVLELLGRGIQTLSRMQELMQSGGNVLIEEERLNSVSDERGMAYFNLQLVCALPGKYQLQFEAKDKRSKPSVTFEVRNHISGVSLENSLEQTLEGRSLKKKVAFEKSPCVRVEYAGGVGPLEMRQGKNIEMKLFEYIDMEELLNEEVLSVESLQRSVASAYGSAKRKQYNQTVLDTVYIFMTTLMNGGRFYDTVSHPEVNMQCHISSTRNATNEYQDCSVSYSETFFSNYSLIQFHDLKMPFPKLGKYALVVLVDGMETQPSDPPIQVVKVEKDTDYAFRVLLEVLSLVTVMVSFMYINLPSFAQVVEIQLERVMSTQTDENQIAQLENESKRLSSNKIIKQNRKALYCFLIPLLFILAYIIILPFYFQWDYVSDPWTISFKFIGAVSVLATLLIMLYNMRRRMDFVIQREHYNNEYTYQRLFNQPSKLWALKNGQHWMGKQSKKSKSDKQNNFMNMVNILKFKKDELRDKSQTQMKKECQQIRLTRQQKETIKLAYESDVKRQEAKSTVRQVLEPLTEFENKLSLRNFFFFPQRLIGSIYVSLFAIVFLHAMLIYLNLNVKESLYQFLSIVEDNFHDTVNQAMSSQASNGLLISEAELKQILDSSNLVYLYINNISISYYVGFVLGVVTADAVQLYSFYKALAGFRNQVLAYRAGLRKLDKPAIFNTTKLVSYHISNSVITFLYQWFVVTVLGTILASQYFWLLLWDLRWTLLFLISNSLVSVWYKILGAKFALGPNFIKSPVLLSLYDLVMLYSKIASGIISGVARSVKLVVFSLLTYNRIDRNFICAWVLERQNLDSINIAFVNTAYLYHISNNPIVCTFSDILVSLKYEKKEKSGELPSNVRQKMLEIARRVKQKQVVARENQLKKSQQRVMEDQDKEEEYDHEAEEIRRKKRKTVRNRFWLYLFLLRNPLLVRMALRKGKKNDKDEEKDEEKSTVTLMTVE